MSLVEYLAMFEEHLRQVKQGLNLEQNHQACDEILCVVITWLLNSRHDDPEIVENRQRIRLLLDEYREVSSRHFWYA